MKVGIIGYGNIGKIIFERLIKSKKMLPNNILISNRTKNKVKHLEKKGVVIAENNEELVKNSDVIFLCVKPQDTSEMFSQIGNAGYREKIFISTIVGAKIKEITQKTGSPYVSRIMPNVPAMIGKGIIPVVFSEMLTKDTMRKKMVINLLKPLGKVVEIEEKHMAAVTAISGSGPAFVFMLIESIIDAGIRLGLSYELARELAIETFKGSAELLQVKGNHPGEFRHLVTSPSGTTIEGIYSLEREGIRGNLMKALWDTYQKAKLFESD